MDLTSEELKIQKRNEYRRKYRLLLPEYELKQRQRPERRERELLRMKDRYQRVKFYKLVKENLPRFLTA